MSAPSAVALVGATASGKSALAHALALELGELEIAAVDSMTLYREMEIGTAKPTAAQRAEVPYHLLDLCDPAEEFTVAQFQRAAFSVEADVAARGPRLLYVGGAGLYGRAVFDRLNIPGRFPGTRELLEARLPGQLAELYQELCALDPLAASRIEPTNQRRIVRALEVTVGSGRPFSSFGAGLEQYGTTTVAQVGLNVAAEELDRRIEERFINWMSAGLLDEVAALRNRPAGLSRTARQAVGYRELLAHLDGQSDLATAVAAATTATRRLARRQRSWFARDPRVEWFNDPDRAGQRLRELLANHVRN